MDKKKLDPNHKISKSVKKADDQTEKSSCARSSSTIVTRKNNKKQEWEKYFCYINDKDREQMMKIPDLPHIKSKKKRKQNKNIRSKSVEIASSSKPTKEKPNIKKENEGDNKLGIKFEKNPIAAPFSTRRKKIPKTKSDEEKNYSEISHNLDSLHLNSTYRYLMRSMKANM